MFFRVFKISGHSMMPRFNPGDIVITTNLPYYFSSPKVGDIVVIRYEKKYMIKKISRIDGKWYMVEGENKNDTLKIPRLKRQEILGKVIVKI